MYVTNTWFTEAEDKWTSWTKLGSKSSEGWFQIDYILAKCRYWNSVRTASCEAVKLEIDRLDNVQESCHNVII